MKSWPSVTDRSILPNPRLPRSPRVRDRWARMRPAPPLERRWDTEPWHRARDPEAAAQAAITPWRNAARATYGAGTVSLYLEEYPHRTVTAVYRPDNPRRTA